MSRLLWVGAGFLGGIVVSRNAAPMANPVIGAVLVGVAILVGASWWGGGRDKKAAVATAVAKATAIASAAADAKAAAIAQAAVNLYVGGAGVETAGQADASSLLPRRLAGRHEAAQLVDTDGERESVPIVVESTAVPGVPVT